MKPEFSVPVEKLVPVSDHLGRQASIPPSRMFHIKNSLSAYRKKYPNSATYDASQGDGGASLPGVAPEILSAAAKMQIDNGTSYDMPFGSDLFRRSVVEDYWKIKPSVKIGPENVIATVGGRDGLLKAYHAMLALGHGYQGDVILVSRVPWISYNWGPYGIGANVLRAPGDADDGWMFSDDAIHECVNFAAKARRKIAGMIITCPDNPTGLTIPPESQVALAKTALSSGIAFVLFDWMYHFVTDEKPIDINHFLGYFDPDERERLIFLDGITKSLGGSNIRNAHLIASEAVIKFISARASHGVIPSFYSMAVAVSAYRMGYENAVSTIIAPTNISRRLLQEFLETHDFKYILGKGYYAFINVGDALRTMGWDNSEPLGQYLAENYGLAVVPGSFFSSDGKDWIRFSYATPPDKTKAAAERLIEGLGNLGR